LKFCKTPLQDVYVIELDRLEDDRGFYARGWCQREFSENGMKLPFVQANMSFSKKKGTLRGMHYQEQPHYEAKLMRCINGAIYECVIDLRPGSATYKKSYGVELSAENRKMLFVPGGFANGFLTLEDNSEVFYQVTEFYHPESECGVRFDDPAFGIEWPIAPVSISDKDRNWPDFDA